MKRSYYFPAIIIALVASACSTNEDLSPIQENKIAKDATPMLLTDASISVYETVFPEFDSKKKPMDSLEVQKKINWEEVFWADFQSAKIGAAKGVEMGFSIGLHFGQPIKGIVIGACVGGGVYGASASVSTAISTCAITGPISTGPEVYIAYPNSVDCTVPITNNCISYNGITTSEMGILHNKVIMALLNEHPIDELMNMSVEEHLDLVSYYAEQNHGIELSDKGKNILMDESITTEYDAKVQEVLQEYFEGLTMLHGSLLFSYSKKFMEMQMEKSLEDQKYEPIAAIVNGAISVYVNSKILWNTYVPDPQIARQFIGCDKNDRWRLMDIDELAVRILSGEIILYGVPKIRKGKITGIFFYEELWENYDMKSEICLNIFEKRNFVFDNADFKMLTDDVVAEEGSYEVYETEHLYSGRTHFVLFE